MIWCWINVPFRTSIAELRNSTKKPENSLEVSKNISDLLLVTLRTHSIEANCFQINYQTDEMIFFRGIYYGARE